MGANCVKMRRVYVVLACSWLLASNAFGQLLSGPLLEENRKLLTKTDFIVEGNYPGIAEYELSVDREGIVKGARLTKTTIKSTPSKMQLKNYALKFKFEPGTYYPQFHHVIVRLTMVKPE